MDGAVKLLGVTEAHGPCSLKSAASPELRRRRSRYLESYILVGPIFLKVRHPSYLLRSHDLYASVSFQAVLFVSNSQPVQNRGDRKFQVSPNLGRGMGLDI